MKFIITSLCILFTLAACAQETKSKNNVQTLIWGGKAAAGGYAPEGTLEVKSTTSEIDGGTIRALKVIIDMKTLSQENKQLTKHLRDKDFFHIKKYPEAIFELTEMFNADSDSLLIGKMTIKNKTQQEKIPVRVSIVNGTMSLTINHTMNRLDYGITYNSPTVFEKIKENAIADEITLKGTLKIQLE